MKERKAKPSQLTRMELVLPHSLTVGWSLCLGASTTLSPRGTCANQQEPWGGRTSPSEAGQPSDGDHT